MEIRMDERSNRGNRSHTIRRWLVVPCLLWVLLGVLAGLPRAVQAAPAIDTSYPVTRSATSGGLGSAAWDAAYAALNAQIAQVSAQCINYRATPISSHLTPYGYVFVVTASADCTH